jgi:hypothetical protein
MSGHTCPAPGCDSHVPRSQLACQRHWYSIPKPLRSEVWRAYRTHGMGSEEHTAAITAAIEFLESDASDG